MKGLIIRSGTQSNKITVNNGVEYESISSERVDNLDIDFLEHAPESHYAYGRAVRVPSWTFGRGNSDTTVEDYPCGLRYRVHAPYLDPPQACAIGDATKVLCGPSRM